MEYSEFTEKIFSLIISKSFLAKSQEIKFILSSINNPTKHIQVFQHKILQQLKFIELTGWIEPDLIKLIDIISKYLKFKLNSDIQKELIVSAKGSPRFIKKYFRNIIAINKKDEDTLKAILSETERELSLNQNG